MALRANCEGGFPAQDLVIGDEYTGRVGRHHREYCVFVNVGADREGMLEVGEMQDGFPPDGIDLKGGDQVTVRILEKDGDKFYLTMRSGDLERPPRESRLSRDASVLAEVPADQWLDGVVNSMTTWGVFVRVQPPLGGEPLLVLLHKDDFKEGFAKEAIRGAPVRVRVRGYDAEKNRALLTMKDP